MLYFGFVTERELGFMGCNTTTAKLFFRFSGYMDLLEVLGLHNAKNVKDLFMDSKSFLFFYQLINNKPNLNSLNIASKLTYAISHHIIANSTRSYEIRYASQNNSEWLC